jgi:hypothetical protein
VESACDSVLLVCGLASRSLRDEGLSAWPKRKQPTCDGSVRRYRVLAK